MNEQKRYKQLIASSINRATLCGLVAQKENHIDKLEAQIKAVKKCDQYTDDGVGQIINVWSDGKIRYWIKATDVSKALEVSDAS